MAFCASLLAAAAVLYVPGGVLLGVVGVPLTLSFVTAPAVTVAFLGLSGIAVESLGLSGPVWLIVGVAVLELFAFVVWALGCLVVLGRSGNHAPLALLRQGRRSCKQAWAPSETVLGLYATAGVVVMGVLFLANIRTVAAFGQFSDNASHLAWVRNFMETGTYSVLHVSAYGGVDPMQASYAGTAFYPAGWHIVVALACQMSSVPLAVVENAVNYLFVAVVYPCAMGAFLERALVPNRAATLFGSVLCCAGAAFPLRPLAVHGIYPNIAGFSLVPALVLLFVEVERSKGAAETYSRILVLLAALAGVALLHPNALIAAVVLYVPRVVLVVVPDRLGQAGVGTIKGKDGLTLRRVAASVMAVLAFLVAWVLLLCAPFMQGIVSFTWDWAIGLPDALALLFSMGLIRGIPQVALSVLCLTGLGVACVRRETRWLAVSLLVPALLFVGCSSGNLMIKRLAAGFWYTDGERMAAIVTIAAVPIASLGLAGLWRLTSAALVRMTAVNTSSVSADAHAGDAETATCSPRMGTVPYSNLFMARQVACALVTLVFVGVNYYPYVAYQGSDDTTAFGASTWELRNAMAPSESQEYTPREMAFVSRVREFVGSNDLVLNNRYDGSVFAYSLGGLNTYYHDMNNTEAYLETGQSRLIRTRLSLLASDPDVRSAVSQTGARYVLLLDRGDYSVDDKGHVMHPSGVSYNANDWRGFDITDDTPGFQVVLSDGDMRLYRIE